MAEVVELLITMQEGPGSNVGGGKNFIHEICKYLPRMLSLRPKFLLWP